MCGFKFVNSKKKFWVRLKKKKSVPIFLFPHPPCPQSCSHTASVLVDYQPAQIWLLFKSLTALAPPSGLLRALSSCLQSLLQCFARLKCLIPELSSLVVPSFWDNLCPLHLPFFSLFNVINSVFTPEMLFPQKSILRSWGWIRWPC